MHVGFCCKVCVRSFLLYSGAPKLECDSSLNFPYVGWVFLCPYFLSKVISDPLKVESTCTFVLCVKNTFVRAYE